MQSSTEKSCWAASQAARLLDIRAVLACVNLISKREELRSRNMEDEGCSGEATCGAEHGDTQAANFVFFVLLILQGIGRFRVSQTSDHRKNRTATVCQSASSSDRDGCFQVGRCKHCGCILDASCQSKHDSRPHDKKGTHGHTPLSYCLLDTSKNVKVTHSHTTLSHCLLDT